MTDSENSEHYPEIDNLNNMIEKLTLNDNFINLKPTVKEEITWNPNITDIPSTSRETNQIGVYFEAESIMMMIDNIRHEL